MAKFPKLVSNAAPAGTSMPQVYFDNSNYVSAGASKTLADTDHMATVLLDTAGGSTVILPTSTGNGKKFRFLVSALATSPNSHVVKVGNSTDVMQGVITLAGVAGVASAFAASATQDTITLNRTTTGSVSKGEWIEIEDLASGIWQVRGHLTASATPVTPFSATV